MLVECATRTSNFDFDIVPSGTISNHLGVRQTASCRCAGNSTNWLDSQRDSAVSRDSSHGGSCGGKFSQRKKLDLAARPGAPVQCRCAVDKVRRRKHKQKM